MGNELPEQREKSREDDRKEEHREKFMKKNIVILKYLKHAETEIKILNNTFFLESSKKFS